MKKLTKKVIACFIAMAIAVMFALPVLASEGVTFVSSDPADGATEVAVDTTITLTFTKNVAKNLNDNISKITLADIAGNAVEFTAAGNQRVITLTPSAELAEDTVYTVNIAAGITAGDGSATPEAVEIKFSTVKGQEEPSSEEPSSEEPSSEEPSSENGGGNGGGTGQGEQIPTLVSTTPADGAADLPVSTAINCLFSNNVIDDSVFAGNTDKFSLADAAGNEVAVNVTKGERNTIVVTPSEELKADTIYVLTVAAGVTAKNGHSTENPYRITFATAKASEESTTASEETTAKEEETTKAEETTTAGGSGSGNSQGSGSSGNKTPNTGDDLTGLYLAIALFVLGGCGLTAAAAVKKHNN